MDDDLWALSEPLLPPWPERSPRPVPVPAPLCLQGILSVLCNDIAWQRLPLELEFGSGQKRWRRLGRWQEAGVFDRLRVLLAELNAAGELHWGPVPAWKAPTSVRKGGADTGPSPDNWRKTGSTI